MPSNPSAPRASASLASKVLVVEDRDALRKLMHRALEQAGFAVASVADGQAALERIAAERFALILTDLKLPGASGLEVVRACREQQPGVPVVVLTAFGTVKTAVEAMKLGALDFLEKPLEIDDLVSLARALAGQADGTAETVFQPPGSPPIVGRHPKLRAALRLLEKVAPTESTVLLTGESGTGKELFAQALHALSSRAGGPLVAVNCAAIPASLMENELFGHEKGAFTGASKRQIGRFELADRGTLFLDEIGELEFAVQSKVLRALEERTFERVGSGRLQRVDVRLVAATNRDLAQMVAAGTFRSDLYFRLDVFPIALPPLRERASDIPLLVSHLTAEIARRLRLKAPEFDRTAGDVLAQTPWPGNVRQLANVLERAVILGAGQRLSATDLQPLLPTPARSDERAEIRQALLLAQGDKAAAARQLGISPRTLQRKVKHYDLEGIPHYRQ